MKYSYEEKLSVVIEIMYGKGLKTLCRERHISINLVRSWVYRYRAFGESGLLKSTRGYYYSPAEKEKIILEHLQDGVTEKEKIILEHLQDGVTLLQLCLRYGLTRSTIQSWLRTVRSGGSLYDVKRRGRPPKDPMARPKKKEPQTELERLQAENLRLRAENALLKKVKALVEEEQKARARLNGQKPSTN